MKIHQTLPKSQVKILKDALKLLKVANTITSENEHLNFDILTLDALLNYDVTISMEKEDYDKFTMTEGVDFPKYIIKK